VEKVVELPAIGTDVRYAQGVDYPLSLVELIRRGNQYRVASQKAGEIWARAHQGLKPEQVFNGIAVTHHGEGRIPNSIKYDLGRACRLVTIQTEKACVFLFAGTHEDTERWLERNRGLQLKIRRTENKVVLEPVRVYGAERGEPLPPVMPDTRPLIAQLNPETRDSILKECRPKAAELLQTLTRMSSDDDIYRLMDLTWENVQFSSAVSDVVLALRADDFDGAERRWQTYTGELASADTLEPSDEVVSGSEIVKLSDIDASAFTKFLETASFERWMLYLHPDQRRIVELDFDGPVRLQGVSGSGKTSILVHRALRLARAHPGERVLVLTLNPALATLLRGLLDAAQSSDRATNLDVMSFWELCLAELADFDPQAHRLFRERTAPAKFHPHEEHIDEIWMEYYRCRLNNQDAEVLRPVHRTLLARGVFAEDYVRQEFDYIRSAVSGVDRSAYLELEREGRRVPLDAPLRARFVEGLAGWERKMEAVGAADYMGVALALGKYAARLRPRYRAVLVDEMQDFGTFELSLIRRLAHRGSNDIFLCGDAAQTVLVKDHRPAQAGIEFRHRLRIQRNYRNAREILEFAFRVLVGALAELGESAKGIEIQSPEYANFTTSPPVMLFTDREGFEVVHALELAQAESTGGPDARACIVVCGPAYAQLDTLARTLGIPLLDGRTDLRSARIVLSDLEQVKGFEFDRVIIVNCRAGIIPHPLLPAEEAFRDICRLYVAMTRAKRDLVISWTGECAPLLKHGFDAAIQDRWENYLQIAADAAPVFLPEPRFIGRMETGDARLPIQDLLYLPAAAGLPAELQDRLEELCPGYASSNRQGQTAWKLFADGYKAWQQPRERLRLRISNEQWADIGEFARRLDLS
jgi:hypothetical protein